MGRERRKPRARGGGDSRLEGQGTRGAHVEHVVHGCDAGRVEAERMVERKRALRSQMQGIRSGSRCGAGGERVWERLRRKLRGRGGADLKAGGAESTRGAHVEHAGHVRDTGRVEAQRLVER